MEKKKLYVGPEINLHEIFSNGVDVIMASGGLYNINPDDYDGSDFI